MKKNRTAKTIISFLVILCMLCITLSPTVSAEGNQVIILRTGISYPTVTSALTAAENGDTIALLADIPEEVDYTITTDKVITIDGQGHTLTAYESTLPDNSYALALFGNGLINLKNITLQGGTCNEFNSYSIGLYTHVGNICVQSDGIVKVIGGAASNSFGLISHGTGTINVTSAIGGNTTTEINTTDSIGINKTNTGTINVTNATGGVSEVYSTGISTSGTGVINVSTAIADHALVLSHAIFCSESSFINAHTATADTSDKSIYSLGVLNDGYGTVNVFQTDNIECLVNESPAQKTAGTVNVGTVSGIIKKTSIALPTEQWGIVNTDAVSTLTLKRDPNTSCVLDSITVSKTGPTNIGTLPSVCKNGIYSNKWYTDSAKTALFTGTTVTGETILYNEFYTAPVPTATPVPTTTATPGGETDSPTSTTKISKLTLSDSSLTMVKGTTDTLKVTSLLPSNATNQKVQWKSSNSTIASVSSSGKVKAKKAGVVTITCAATDGSGIKATCKITVTESSTNRIKVAWKKKTGVAGYQVNLYKGSKRISRKYTAKTFYTFSKLKAGTAYKIVIKPYTKKGKTKRIGKTLATILTATRPTTPSTTLKTGSKKVYLSWKKVSGANGYELVLSAKKASGYKHFKTITKGTTVKYTKAKLTKGKTYYFKIRAYKKINGQKVYGSYSTAKNIKVK